MNPAFNTISSSVSVSLTVFKIIAVLILRSSHHETIDLRKQGKALRSIHLCRGLLSTGGSAVGHSLMVGMVCFSRSLYIQREGPLRAAESSESFLSLAFNTCGWASRFETYPWRGRVGSQRKSGTTGDDPKDAVLRLHGDRIREWLGYAEIKMAMRYAHLNVSAAKDERATIMSNLLTVE